MTYKDEPEITVDVAAEESAPLTQEQKKFVDPLNSGFVWYTPPISSNEVWQISGHDMQVLSMSVPPNGTIISEVGAFMFGSPTIKSDVELTLCAKGGCNEGCQRICGGESCVKLIMHNESDSQGYVGLTPNFPAKIIPIKFGQHISENHSLIAQPGAYMAHLGDVDVKCSLDCSLTQCCIGPFGLCRQKISGSSNSVAFIAAGGTLLYRNLEPGEKIIVDQRSVVAVDDTVEVGYAYNGRFCTCCFGGEGCFSATLTGPGKVFMQSIDFYKFRDAVQVTVVEDRGTVVDATPTW